MDKTFKVMCLMVSLFGVCVLGLGSYILVDRLQNSGNYEAVEIVDVNSLYATNADLGVINPGETKQQEIVVQSLINYNVDFNVSFICENDTYASQEFDLLKYITIDLSIGEESFDSATLRNCIDNNLIFSSSIEPKGSKRLYISYTLADADIPMNESLDFKIVVEAKNRTIM